MSKEFSCGVVNKYWQGCRCGPCTQAERAHHRERYSISAAKAGRAVRPYGTPKPERPVLARLSATCGSNTMYVKGCRCRPCTDAHAAHKFDYRNKRAKAKGKKRRHWPSIVKQHGTRSMY